MAPADSFDYTRRNWLRSLVAIGGSSALSACLAERGGGTPTGTDDPSALPDRQHAWNDYSPRDDDRNVKPPKHHVLVALSLREEPTSAARQSVETCFRTLESGYEWSTNGLLFTVGYTQRYFDRFNDAPDSIDLPAPTSLTPRESPEIDDFDALIHLASDRPDVVLEAEEAMLGDRETVNGVEVEADLTDAFERVVDHRRTGFIGPGLPAERTDHSGVPDSVPEAAPFFMGFRSGFAESQATEDRVTIDSGPFAGGTTQHVSTIALQLDVWFEQDSHEQRVSKMFSPEHAAENLVGEVGESLTTTNGLTTERIEATAEDARHRGVVGHAQKAARGRIDGQPILLRRDFNTMDTGGPGIHFVSLHRTIDDFVRVREAMNGSDLAGSGVGEVLNNGILQYLFVERRGNYLVPPRRYRALPAPDPTEVANFA